MSKLSSLVLAAPFALLTGCAGLLTGSGDSPPGAASVLRDAAGREMGAVSLAQQEGGGVRVRITARGLTPGAHGVHLHAVGACDGSTTPAFSSAGGHFNPHGREHGRLNPAGAHAGDLPNLVADARGEARLDAVVADATLAEGAATLFDADGTAVVVHQNEDDGRTNTGPAGPGNSGPRVACGVVARS